MAGSLRLLLSDMVVHGRSTLPSQYVRPISDCPNVSDVIHATDAKIPLIDLAGINGADRHNVVEAIGQACQTDGFFQIKNHGIPKTVVEGMLLVAQEFFQLPTDERLKYYSDDPKKSTRLSTSFNVRIERVSNWRDFLRLHCYPLEDFAHEWPSNPPSFWCVQLYRYDSAPHSFSEFSSLYGGGGGVLEPCEGVRSEVARGHLREPGASEGLYGEGDGEASAAHGRQLLPAVPDPGLTYGLPGHKDPNAITILLQDDIARLQVLKNGKWVAVNPIPDTLIINIGDQIQHKYRGHERVVFHYIPRAYALHKLVPHREANPRLMLCGMQVLSNDRYASVLHRALVNSSRERISVPTFYCPSPEALIGPPLALVNEEHPAAYRSFTYGEYYQKFWNWGLATGSCLDMFRLSP
ncbi:hypothetical protein Taro_045477 [Colocasia esculenta]|uniref:Fe2OG dioxygenase domain-containing protein n=1 Tax=Colocasia esculenta TaxID=4460 RepID=A0A843X6K6_COLES|nr:hypothetical protein [Colocasia esculenta]